MYDQSCLGSAVCDIGHPTVATAHPPWNAVAWPASPVPLAELGVSTRKVDQ